jgi:hypothetical protein
MDELSLNREFFKNRKLKSFIRVGTTFIDIKQTIGFSFIDNPDGYLVIQFVYDTGRVLNAFLTNRNEFAQFLLELDPFIDDPTDMKSIEEFINEIEKTFKINTKNIIEQKPKRKYKRKDKGEIN